MSDKDKFYDQSTGKEMEIPAEGSLGLLALGDVSVKPWRQKRIDTGYEKDLLERLEKQRIEGEKKREQIKKKREELKAKQQEKKLALEQNKPAEEQK